jgi:hypothetical protein
MQRYKAAIAGGLVAGVVTTVVMVAGRKTGVLTKTLDRDAVDWVDDLTGSRAVIILLCLASAAIALTVANWSGRHSNASKS